MAKRKFYFKKEELEEKYNVENLTIPQIAHLYECSENTIERRFKEFSIPIKNKIKDITGETFGSLYVISIDDTKKHRNPYWKCKCSCGKTVSVCGSNLRGNKAFSCKNCRYGCVDGYEGIAPYFIGQIKNGAKARNHKFDIDAKTLWDLYEKQERKCALTGFPIVFQKFNNRNQCTASLDRIDSKKGYTIDNIQWVHKDVNRCKSNFTELRFLEICKVVTENSK